MANINGAQLLDNLQRSFDVRVGFRERQIRQPFPSGIAAIDQVLNGGFPRAALSEVSGGQSSNRTALIVSTVVHAVNAGE